mmetsp:Transcript_44304/g.141857  ORF Transcript_44304/g.141857 Transcript_44304/m.141857 type:complete len:176 (-) Transcript_44304:28-555(-)
MPWRSEDLSVSWQHRVAMCDSSIAKGRPDKDRPEWTLASPLPTSALLGPPVASSSSTGSTYPSDGPPSSSSTATSPTTSSAAAAAAATGGVGALSSAISVSGAAASSASAAGALEQQVLSQLATSGPQDVLQLLRALSLGQDRKQELQKLLYALEKRGLVRNVSTGTKPTWALPL